MSLANLEGLGIVHIVQIGQPQDAKFPQDVLAAKTIAITIWPIMFAAIATQSLKAYGTFQAERGIKLMVSSVPFCFVAND